MPGEYSYAGLENIKLLPEPPSSSPSLQDIVKKINEIAKKVNILIDLEDSRIDRRQ